MSEMNEYTPELYELEDENGNKKDFEMIDALEIDGQQYFAMIPAYDENNVEELINYNGELVILKTDEVNGEEFLVSIPDDDEYERIAEIFLKRLEETLDESDEEDLEN